ncbi:MAG: hypothetical protein AAFU61_14690, partial [Pseudomonadota bacterium]
LRMMGMATDFHTSMYAYMACKYKIADQLALGPKTASEIAATVGAPGSEGAADPVFAATPRGQGSFDQTVGETLVYAHGARAKVVEGQTIKFTIVRAGDDSKRVSVAWSLNDLERTDLEPGQDVTGEVVFAAGESGAKTLRFQLREDGRAEGTETFSLQLGSLSREDAAFGTREVLTDLLDGRTGTGRADVLVGSDGVDVLIGRGGADRIKGLGGADEINGGNGADVLLGGKDADDVTGGGGDDEIRGGGGADAIQGGGGDDSILGNTGDDVIDGGGGSDFIRGGGGDDRIDGGAGADLMFGGAGADDFIFRNGHSGPARADRDTIEDFSVGVDDIQLFAGSVGFTFIGASGFTGAPAQIRAVERDDRHLVQGDLDGDGEADVAVWVRTLDEGVLTSGDFI